MSWTSFRSLSPKAMSKWRTGIPRDRGLRPFVHVLRSRRLQHLRGLIRHVLDKLPLVVPEGHVEVEDGDPPRSRAPPICARSPLPPPPASPRPDPPCPGQASARCPRRPCRSGGRGSPEIEGSAHLCTFSAPAASSISAA